MAIDVNHIKSVTMRCETNEGDIDVTFCGISKECVSMENNMIEDSSDRVLTIDFHYTHTHAANLPATEICEYDAVMNAGNQTEDGSSDNGDATTYQTTPKGIAWLALRKTEILDDQNDHLFDDFWDLFSAYMEKAGYAHDV